MATATIALVSELPERRGMCSTGRSGPSICPGRRGPHRGCGGRSPTPQPLVTGDLAGARRGSSCGHSFRPGGCSFRRRARQGRAGPEPGELSGGRAARPVQPLCRAARQAPASRSQGAEPGGRCHTHTPPLCRQGAPGAPGRNGASPAAGVKGAARRGCRDRARWEVWPWFLGSAAVGLLPAAAVRGSGYPLTGTPAVRPSPLRKRGDVRASSRVS